MKKLIILFMIFLISLFFVSASSIFLSDHLEEGETKVYETENGSYVVSLLAVSDRKEKAVFRLNNEMSKGIKRGDSYVFEDGSEIVVRELIISEAEDRNDEAYYYFYGTGKKVLPLKNISKNIGEDKLCNFDAQCLNESRENCCYDCGCDEDEKCLNNKCVLSEEKKQVEEVEEEIIKEEEEDVAIEEKTEIKKEENEKKVVYGILIIILVFVGFMVWYLYKKRKKIF